VDCDRDVKWSWLVVRIVNVTNGYWYVLSHTYFPKSQDGIDSVVEKRVLFMCRRASLFFSQWVEGSITCDARDYKKPREANYHFLSCKASRRRKFTPSEREIRRSRLSMLSFPPECASSWTRKTDRPGDYRSNSPGNLERPPDYGQINNWATAHLIWLGWVHHS